MQVLLVDSYSNNKLGRSAFSAFKRMIVYTLEEVTNEKHDIIVRKIDHLKDYICDWEHDILNEKLKGNCLKFDKLDLICIGGDMKICPWEPLFTHAITLLHMANLCNKPVLGFGSGN